MRRRSSGGALTPIAFGARPCCAIAGITLAFASTLSAQTLRTADDVEPPVPPARGPGPGAEAVRVALVDSGVDYTLPLIRDALARTGDGTPLGIDFRDLDHRPFDAQRGPGDSLRRHGTRVASVLLAEAPQIALVPYRYPGQDMRLMHALVEHAAAIGVRVIGLPLGSDDAQQWRAFERAARRHPELLFVASAGNDGRDLDRQPLYPASLALDNLVTVSSADDFGRASPESGIGRIAVDWLVPAEAVPVIDFGGGADIAAGSSYAVPRLVARYAREFDRTPQATAAEVIARVRSAHANGLQPQAVGDGMIADPLSDMVGRIDRVPEPAHGGVALAARAAADRVIAALGRVHADSPQVLEVPLELLVLDDAWEDASIASTLAEAAAILAQCRIDIAPVSLDRVLLDTAERLRDLHIGAAHTLFDRLGRNGRPRGALVLFARDTRMQRRFDAEAFGSGNTRDRGWLVQSVWLTAALAVPGADAGIALAHELFHVFANDGSHLERTGNLMTARTAGGNRRLDAGQCELARDGLIRQRLAVVR